MEGGGALSRYSTVPGAHKRKERVTSMLGVMKHCQGFRGVW